MSGLAALGLALGVSSPAHAQVGKGLIDLNSAPEKETQPADVGRRTAGALAVYRGRVSRRSQDSTRRTTSTKGYRTTHHSDRVMPAATWPMIPRRVELAGESTPAKDRTGIVLEEGGPRITAMEVDHAPMER